MKSETPSETLGAPVFKQADDGYQEGARALKTSVDKLCNVPSGRRWEMLSFLAACGHWLGCKEQWLPLAAQAPVKAQGTCSIRNFSLFLHICRVLTPHILGTESATSMSLSVPLLSLCLSVPVSLSLTHTDRYTHSHSELL